MTSKISRKQLDAYKRAILALDDVTAVMVPAGAGTEQAGDLVRVEGFVAVVKLASGPHSGRTLEYPVTMVRPAAPFEVIS